MTKYHFVTTPVYETWSKTSLNLLAGEWCRIFKDENILNQFKYEIAEYHWDDRGKYYKDSEYLRSINLRVLTLLTDELNNYHKTNYPKKFWHILIGPWLHKFTHIIFDKYEVLSEINNAYKPDNTYILNLNSENFVPTNTKMFTLFIRDDLWHHHIFSKILTNFFNINYNLIDFDTKNESLYLKFLDKKLKKSPITSFLKKFETLSKKLFNTNQHKYFVKNSYLSIKDEILLNLYLNKSLSFNLYTPENNFYINKLRRDNFIKNSNQFDDKFLNVLMFMIKEHMPSIYLESFNKLDMRLKNLKWPHDPKKIFTANAYEFDETFKLYSAKKVIDGSKLIIGQHGGAHGMGKWNLPEEHQIDISDNYLTWGWRTENKKVKDGFVFTNLESKGPRYQINKKGIFITHPIERYPCKTQAWPAGASQSYKYMNEHIDFFNNLDENIQKNFIFRVSKSADDLYKTNYIDRIKKSFPNIEIDTRNLKLLKQLNRCKLACSPYNSTSYLQTLLMNYPTMIFWNNKYFELRETSIKYFDKLKSAGIFHTSAISASNHINLVWGDIDTWWRSDKVQETRKFFCDRYTRIKNNKIYELNKFIKEI